MSRHNNSILAAAVIGALYAAGASAQFNLSISTTPLRYAAELNKPVSILESASNGLAFNLGYNFTDGEVRYARLECTSNLTFINPIVETVTPAGAAVVGSLNNAGSAVFFSITDPVGNGATALANTTIALGAPGTNNNAIYSITDNNPVVCEYSLYDTPSQAQAGGTAGRIVRVNNTFINSAPSFTFTTTLGSSPIADVEAANGAYFGFLGTDRSIGSFTLALVTSPPLNANGAIITLADIFSANTAVRINGDLSAFTAASGHATLDDCAGTTAFNTFSAANGVASATFANGAGATAGRFVCFTASGTAAIPEGSYTASLLASANPGYTTPISVGPLPIGSIIRNGTQIQAPLVQIPGGYISRVALTNTGNVVRTFNWTFRPASGGTASETSTTYTGSTTGTGTIPANGSSVLSMVDVLGGLTSFGGTPPRGTFTVSVAAPNSQIQGLYQIVNPSTGAISNHVMVRPGTN